MHLRLTPFVAAVAFFFASALHAQGDRIYIMNSLGYNQADPPLIAAMESLGHTVDESAMNAPSLPPTFVSACVDPENGYHWLCFFGTQDNSALLPDVQAFLADGGKVLLQYEVTCCATASQSAAALLSGATGLTVTPNPLEFLALSVSPNITGWEAVSSTGCLNIAGNAYKCMDGLPEANKLLATANVNGSSPEYTECTNFGFVFTPEDLPGGSGGIVGFGDINLYYESAGEPPNSGGAQPVDMDVVELVFGGPSSKCQLLPSGCLFQGMRGARDGLLGAVYPNPASDVLFVEVLTGNAREYQLLNAQGQRVRSGRSAGKGLLTIPVHGLAEGVYRLVMLGGEARETVTFSVVR